MQISFPMSTPSNGPQKSCIAQALDAWLLAAHEQRATLHRQAADLCQREACQEALANMSALLQQAFEEVRIVSEALREESQAVRGTSADLRTHAIQLMERGTTLLERMAQFAPPPPEKMQQAESRILEMFKDGHSQEDS